MNDNNNSKFIELKDSFRVIFANRAILIRALIFSTIHQLGDYDAVFSEQLNNTNELVAMFKNIYGEEMARSLERLLIEQQSLIANILTQMQQRNINVTGFYKNEYLKVTNELGELLASVNPYWTKEMIYNFYSKDLQTLMDLATYRLNSQFDKSIKEFLNNQQISRDISDYIAEGVYNQFYANQAYNYIY